MKSFLIFWLLLVPVAYSAPAVNSDNVLDFKARAHLVEGRTIIEVSGLVMHSSYVVDYYEVKKIDQDKTSLVLKLSKPKEGFSGSFIAYIPLKSPDDIILFGPKATVIWPK